MKRRTHPGVSRGASSAVAALAVAAVAASCSPDAPEGPTPGRPHFDGDAAYQLVRHQVALGPRIPGSEGHARQAAWMVQHLQGTGADVVVDSFTHVAADGNELPLMNVLARFRPEATRRVLFLAHWDTRPTSDQDPDPERRQIPVPGANDGASGTAVLLHLASLLGDAPPPMGVDLLLVDGEDYGPTVDDMLLGSKRYAEQLPEEGRPVYGVLLDMVGDADPLFPPEGLSAQYASPVVQKILRTARRLGYEEYFPERVGRAVTDDHVPLLEAGLPTANVIDMEYGPNNRYWHTPDDTPERVSPTTLEMVGEVVTELIYSGG